MNEDKIFVISRISQASKNKQSIVKCHYYGIAEELGYLWLENDVKYEIRNARQKVSWISKEELPKELQNLSIDTLKLKQHQDFKGSTLEIVHLDYSQQSCPVSFHIELSKQFAPILLPSSSGEILFPITYDQTPREIGFRPRIKILLHLQDQTYESNIVEVPFRKSETKSPVSPVTIPDERLKNYAQQDFAQALSQQIQIPVTPYVAHPVMTLKQVAEYLQVSESNVEKLIQQKKIRGKKIGGDSLSDWRVSKAEVDRFLQNDEDENMLL